VRSQKLPARFAWLTRVTTVVVATSAATATKTMATASWTFGFGFGLVYIQGSSTQICTIQGLDCVIGFIGICHFDESETPGTARIPIGYKCDLFDRAMCFEDISQLRFGCAVRQISNVKVLHRSSSLCKSSN
jgi:hypothetical protein